MEAVFCHNCGHRNPPEVNFCSSCGAVLAPESGDTTVTLQPVDVAGEATEEDSPVTVVEIPRGPGALVVKRGPNIGARFLLDERPATRAGRHPESDIFLDDITVSRRHAEFTHDDGKVVVRDLGSLNGTYVNGERIDEATLSAGDIVQVGKFQLVYLVADDQ